MKRLVALILAIPLVLAAQTVSPKVLSARTVYVDNQTGFAYVGDRAMEELKKWGRFKLIADREEADFIMTIVFLESEDLVLDATRRNHKDEE